MCWLAAFFLLLWQSIGQKTCKGERLCFGSVQKGHGGLTWLRRCGGGTVALSVVVAQAGYSLTSLWLKKPKEFSVKARLDIALKECPKQPTSSCRAILPTVRQPPKTAPPTRDQVFKRMALWDTNHIQTIISSSAKPWWSWNELSQQCLWTIVRYQHLVISYRNYRM